MQDPPDWRGLIESVRQFLEAEVVPAAPDARLRFRARIAANVLGIAMREVASEADLLAAELSRLSSLLGEVRAAPAEGHAPIGELRERAERLRVELARRIREGSAPARPDTPLWDHLRRTAVERLRVANPALLRRRGEGSS